MPATIVIDNVTIIARIVPYGNGDELESVAECGFKFAVFAIIDGTERKIYSGQEFMGAEMFLEYNREEIARSLAASIEFFDWIVKG